MLVRTCTAVGGLVIVYLGWGILGTALAQEPSAPVETVPAPAGQQQRPDTTYGPLQAGQDAYRLAEEQRRFEVNRQLQVLDEVRRLNPWTARYVPSSADIYALAGRRAALRAYRYGFAPAFTPWPYVPGHIYGYPYYPWVRQPIGHEKIWTGPNSYIYRPRYAPPEASPEMPPEAAPEPPPGPEAIPTPAAEPGPQEF